MEIKKCKLTWLRSHKSNLKCASPLPSNLSKFIFLPPYFTAAIYLSSRFLLYQLLYLEKNTLSHYFILKKILLLYLENPLKLNYIRTFSYPLIKKNFLLKACVPTCALCSGVHLTWSQKTTLLASLISSTSPLWLFSLRIWICSTLNHSISPLSTTFSLCPGQALLKRFQPDVSSSLTSSIPNPAQKTVLAHTWPLLPSFGYCNPTLSSSLTSWLTAC